MSRVTRFMRRSILPFLLIVLAILSAGVFAYGTHSALGQYPNGLKYILLARRFEWLMFALSLGFCLALFFLIVSGKRRAVWLLSLAPVLALFFQKFTSDPMNAFLVLDNPPMVSVGEAARFMKDTDYVVGVKASDGASYAYPYAALYVAPVVFQADHEKRFVVLWSAFANRAQAFAVDRDLKARDVEVVSFPANAPLLYNKRWGQFVNALTVQTPSGEKPSGFRAPLVTTKTTWGAWRAANPSTQVLSFAAGTKGLPTAPVLPYYPMPPRASTKHAVDMRISIVHADEPIAIASDAVPNRPLNVSLGKTPFMLFRDGSGKARAFDRHVEEDMIPQFLAHADPKRPGVVMVDSDTLSGWSIDGKALDGSEKVAGKKLKPLAVEEDVYYGVMKYWSPGMQFIERQAGDPEPPAYEPPPPPKPERKPPVRRRTAVRSR